MPSKRTCIACRRFDWDLDADGSRYAWCGAGHDEVADAGPFAGDRLAEIASECPDYEERD